MSKEVKRYYVQLWRMEEAKFAPGPLGACEMVKASDYDALLAERDQLRSTLIETRRLFVRDTDELIAERDALKKDAERYRWLREQEAEDGMAILPIGKWVKPAMLVTTPFDSPEMVDSVIDAALQGEQP